MILMIERERKIKIFSLVCVFLGLSLFIPPALSANNVADSNRTETNVMDFRDKVGIEMNSIFEEVKNYIGKKDYNQALSILAPYTSEPLKYQRAVSDYIVILIWAGRGDEAIRHFETLPKGFQKRAYLLRNMASVYFQKGRYEKAFTLYRESLEKEPSDLETQKGLLRSLIKLERLEDALLYVKRLPQVDDRDINLLRAYIFFKNRKYIEAFNLYKRIMRTSQAGIEEIKTAIEDMIASLKDKERKHLLETLQKAGMHDYYIISLVIYRDYKGAITIFEDKKGSLEISDHLLSWMGWAYFKAGDIDNAKRYYNLVLKRSPDNLRAIEGLVYCLAREKKFEEAFNLLERMPEDDIKTLFARAFVYEQKGYFWDAIKEYDFILSKSSDNRIARKLRLRALSDLGGSSLAFEKAYRILPEDRELQISFFNDMAVKYIRWKEPLKAKGMLLYILSESPENKRAMFDYITALAENVEMERVVKEYEVLVKKGIDIPSWVLENVAKAYLYLQRPEKALELYNRALEKDPKSYDARMGKFYTLQELRRFNEAYEILDELDREQPEYFSIGNRKVPNWYKLEIASTRGWVLAYEERLREAEEQFWDLRKDAPADMGIRTGLAHVYLWRGWPRKALKEFRIIDTLDPENLKAQIGMMATLNELAYKEEAREGAKELYKKHPENRHVQQLMRQLKIEEMTAVVGDFVVSADEDGFGDITAQVKLNQPIDLFTQAYGLILWKQSSEEGEKRYFYRRAGIGIEHIFNSSWKAVQQFTVDYGTGKDFGSYTWVEYTPDDYWRFSLSHDSFTTDVPLRARVFDIDAKKSEFSVTYRESEWREYNLGVSFLDFSDGNRRLQGRLGYEQGLYVRNNWRLRGFLDFYTSRNSERDTPYFNPRYDFSLSTTLMTEYTHWRIYNKAFLQRLYLTIGAYKQADYSSGPIWGLRYEHDYEFSDTQALLWGLSISRNIYDGEPVHGYSFYLNYRGRF